MILNIKSVFKSYGETSVLKDITLNIDNVSAVGIIGESGCGKSTLLRQLAGIEKPDRGEISINGISPIIQKREFQEKIGYVFQKHNLFPHLTVRKNLSLILEKIKKLDKKTTAQIINTTLKQLHIEGEADKLPNEISGGQAQRASIARALVTDPDLIFLDEPTAALDPILSDEVLQSVKELKNTGREFIFVTHEMSFLREFADYVIFMKQGKIIESGKVECFDNPKTKQLTQFLNIR